MKTHESFNSIKKLSRPSLAPRVVRGRVRSEEKSIKLYAERASIISDTIAKKFGWVESTITSSSESTYSFSTNYRTGETIPRGIKYAIRMSLRYYKTGFNDYSHVHPVWIKHGYAWDCGTTVDGDFALFALACHELAHHVQVYYYGDDSKWDNARYQGHGPVYNQALSDLLLLIDPTEILDEAFGKGNHTGAPTKTVFLEQTEPKKLKKLVRVKGVKGSRTYFLHTEDTKKLHYTIRNPDGVAHWVLAPVGRDELDIKFVTLKEATEYALKEYGQL